MTVHNGDSTRGELYFHKNDGTQSTVPFTLSKGIERLISVPANTTRIDFFVADGEVNPLVLQFASIIGGAVTIPAITPSSTELIKLLKYKVEMPIGAKVTLFDDESVEVQFLSWDIPCPASFPNMTFLQVKAANGREAQINPSAGSQTMELYLELGRRYAVFGEIWTYSFAQTLWIASLRIQKSDYEWQDCVPTAGEGGTTVTILPQ